MAVMTTSSLLALSNDLADLSAANGAAIVQVLGARRPATGVIHGTDTILTTGRAVGREDGVRVRVGDSEPIEAELIGWETRTWIAVLQTRTPLAVAPLSIAKREPRVGEIVL